MDHQVYQEHKDQKDERLDACHLEICVMLLPWQLSLPPRGEEDLLECPVCQERRDHG